MLTAILAGSGGRVLVPDAVAVVEGETYGEVNFVDAEGRVVATFNREDLAMYSDNGNLPLPEASEQQRDER